MKPDLIAYQNREPFYRLVAVWVICEAFLGGIMHGMKLPFTGLVVSGMAVSCIILIARYVPGKGTILKATIIVAIFKLMLSPHAPPTAYIAVFFQGLMGQLLFTSTRFFKLSAILLAILSMVESAIQRILVLMIVYGNEFWNAVNQYIQKLTGDKQLTNYSLWLAIIYIIIHAIVGFFIGSYASRLALHSEIFKMKYPHFIIKNMEVEALPQPAIKKKIWKIKGIFIFLYVLLLAMWAYGYFFPTKSVITVNTLTGLLFRSILIALSWFLLIGPLIIMALKKWMAQQEQIRKPDINEVMLLLPQTRHIFQMSWKLSATQSGLKRIRLFFKIILLNVLIVK